jgi:hypothetical protein
MTISSIIITLGLQIILSEQPAIDCGYIDTPVYHYKIDGCQNGNKIILAYSAKDINETMYHEIGHRLFLYDSEVKEMISKYPSPKKYNRLLYKTDNDITNEKVADYFLMYMKYPDFGKKFPEVKELFDKKINAIMTVNAN